MTKTEYSAHCEPTQAGGWKAHVEEPDCEAHARRLDQLKEHVALSIHHETGMALCDIVVRLEGVFPDALDAFQSAHRKIDQANTLRHEAAQEIRQVVARLRSEGLTMRDISALLGITPQRVSQLTASPSSS